MPGLHLVITWKRLSTRTMPQGSMRKSTAKTNQIRRRRIVGVTHDNGARMKPKLIIAAMLLTVGSSAGYAQYARDVTSDPDATMNWWRTRRARQRLSDVVGARPRQLAVQSNVAY
jgi:hypothetical protein